MTDIQEDPSEFLTDDEFDAEQIVDWLETYSLVKPKDLPSPPTSAREGELQYAHQNMAAWRLVPEAMLRKYGLTAHEALSLMEQNAGR